MTETEKLKEARDRQYVQERHQEVRDYLNRILDEFNVLTGRSRKWLMYELAAVVAMLVASFGPNIIWTIAWLLWLGLFLYRAAVLDREVAKKSGEIDGAFEVLFILGFMDRPDFGNKKKRKVKRKSLFKKFKEWFERIPEQKEAYGR